MRGPLSSLVAIALTALTAAGCGAYAGAAAEDGGGTPVGSLSFTPDPLIHQGEYRQFSIAFAEPPPWSGADAARGYLVRFAFLVDGEERADIEFVTNYDGLQTITTTLHATDQAETGERTLEVTAAYEPAQGKQQFHQARDSFYVLRANNADGGDGGDGGGG